MQYLPTYDSRDSRYKTPYGAVASGTQVQFTLRPPRAESYSRALFTARFESRHDETVIMKMPWQGHDLGQDLFSVELDTMGYVGLIWYSFQLIKLDGRKQDLGPYQLTVYDGEEEVPSWFDPEGLVGAGGSIRAGRSSPSTAPTTGARCATGTSSAGIFRA